MNSNTIFFDLDEVVSSACYHAGLDSDSYEDPEVGIFEDEERRILKHRGPEWRRDLIKAIYKKLVSQRKLA